MLQGPVVGILGLWFVVFVVPYHPEVVVASWMVAAGDLLAPGAEGHAAGAHAVEVGLTLTEQGEVDVQAHAAWQGLLQYVGGDALDVGTQRVEVGIRAVVAEREGDAGDILHAALHDHAHGARVVGVHRAVVAVVDAAEHQVGPTGHHLVKGQLDAVDGRAVARPDLYARFLVAQGECERRVGREGAGHARAWPFGCAYDDVAQVAYHFDEAVNAFGLIAVVVGDEYEWSVHRIFLLLGVQS